ncbi:MAG TPA: xanthine dehydrogenase family protein subunit M [Candidatus Atribacteria bacterium]|nr:xanthine dehydrogenase family protein subunit M [Candidatus Atribacteria bacterium]
MIRLTNNTKILTQEFEYFAPKTLAGALDLLYRYQDKNTRILAGGTDLLVKMKTIGLDADYLISIKEIPELKFIDTDAGLRIGAAVPLSHIEKIEKVREKYPALYESIKSMAAIAIRNMATMPGNICNASPAGDTIPPLIAYEAKLKLVSKRGERTVLVEDFITGVGKTIIKRDELLTQVIIPEISKNSGGAFLKKGRVKADIAKINLAVCLKREGEICKDCRIVLGSVFIKAVRAKKAEELLRGQVINNDLIIKTAKKASEVIKPIDDIRSTAEYRTELARVMTEDALKLAWGRAGGEL